MRGKARKVICLQDGAVYESLAAAAAAAGVDSAAIHRVCNRQRPFAAGLTWRYLDELLVPSTQNMSLRQICDRELAGMAIGIIYNAGRC